MRKGQGLPVNMIVLTALALLVLVVVGAFFVSGFGEASGSVSLVNASEADCQSYCQSATTAGFNYKSCTALAANPRIKTYVSEGCPDVVGPCFVTISGGTRCECSGTDDTPSCS